MPYGLPDPDPRIVRRLRRIDKDLSVEIVPTSKGPRYAVFHGLQVFARYDRAVDIIARDLQQTAAANGYILDLTECAMAARDTVHRGKLVCYVTEDTGDYRPLDGRIVEKLQRMDYWRKNWGVGDWRAMLKAKADALAERQLRASNDIWDAVRRDPVFARQVSDICAGLRPARSVIVPSNYTGGPHGPVAVRHS